MAKVNKPTLLAQCRPIACIELIEDRLIVCEGPGVSVFSKDGVKLNQATLFPLDKTILGISVLEGKDYERGHLLFAYGQNFSKIVHYCDRTFKFFSSVLWNLGDDQESLSDVTYIAARWLNKGKKLAAITDENVLHIYEWNFVPGDIPNVELKLKGSQRKVIRGVQTSLFSADLSGACEEDLLVFSGTNLSQIYVWCPEDRSKNYHLLIEGIKGSVLSLKYSEENQILVASSDQRSVFAWKLESGERAEGLGFTGSTFIRGSVTVSLIAEMIGHTGRVWQVDILRDSIVSAGQDSNLLLWDTSGRLKKIFSGPSVVNIRCCRLEPTAESVVSGSDDGSVCRWNLLDPFTTTTVELIDSPEAEENDYPRQVTFYNRRWLLVAMNSGKFILVEKAGERSPVFFHPEFLSYSKFAISPDRKLMTIGSKTGWLYVVSLQAKESCAGNIVVEGVFMQKIKFDSKIVSLHWADAGTIVLSTCTKVCVLQLEGSQLDSEWKEITTFKISWKDKPGVAGVVSVALDGEKFLILGDELGSVHLFRLGQESDSPLFTLPKLHGSYGVCDMKIGSCPDEVWSVGRNRLIINLKLQVSPDPSLVIIQTVESCLSWNARLINSTLGSFVCGFSENDFVVLDLVEDRIVKKFPCGGAHRSWDVAVDSLFSFAFIRHKRLTLSEFGLDSINIQNGIFGGKTINVVTACPDLLEASKEGYQNLGMLTAGEDAFLRFSRASVQLSQRAGPEVSVHKVAKFKSHASSVRVIKFHHIREDNALLIFSGGGRSQIVASFLQSKANNVIWSKRASIMLQTPYNSRKESSDPDMRIMDIFVKNDQRDHFTLVCACSDGYVRLVGFHSQRFSLLSSFNQYGSGTGELHAFTQIHLLDSPPLIYGSNSIGQLMLFAYKTQEMKSDPFPGPCSFIKSEKTNAAGITALNAIRESEGEDYIITGSDDGILKAFRVQHNSQDKNHNNCNFSLVFEDRIHHSAAINSVIISKHKLIIVASADQMVSVRQLDGKVLKSFRCGVSDVQSVTVAESPSSSKSLLILLVGQGFEMLHINL